MAHSLSRLRSITLTSLTISLAACGGGEDDAAQNVADPPPASSIGNTAPTISGSPPTTATAGATYAFTPSASDVNNDSLTFSGSNIPTWASLNATTGALTGTAATGTYSNIVVSVSDGQASAALPPFTLTVQAATTPPPANSAPTISGAPATTATVGTAYSFVPSASDADRNALTFSITNRPSWATFNATTGRLSGTPSAAGNHSNIVISVSDGQVSRSLPAFSITVTATAPANRAPTISGSPSSQAMQGQAYAFTPSARDADGDSLSFAIANQPSWASFSPSTGSLTGTPTAADVGTYGNIVISVSDGLRSTSLAAFGIQVVATATGSVTLTWAAPTQNTDGTAATDLAGFKLYWGTSPGNYTGSATLASTGVLTYVVTNLTPATWFFSATAVNAQNIESAFSSEVSKVVQ